MLIKVLHRFTNLLLVLALALAVLLVAPRVLGMDSYAVISASMHPALPVGSLIYVQKTDPVNIVAGDVVSFRLGSTVATHRVVAANPEARTFITKGDRNENPDGAPLPWSGVIGKVVFHVPFLGALSQWLTPLRAGVAVAALLLLTFLPNPAKKKREQAA